MAKLPPSPDPERLEKVKAEIADRVQGVLRRHLNAPISARTLDQIRSELSKQFQALIQEGKLLAPTFPPVRTHVAVPDRKIQFMIDPEWAEQYLGASITDEDRLEWAEFEQKGWRGPT